MILSNRVHHPPSHTFATYTMNSELAPCFSTPELLASPPTTPPRGHKHSFSKSITWLNRSSSSTSNSSAPFAAPKPTRISEPKYRSSLEQLNYSHRVGLLGSGATVVRTPQEALFGSTHGSLDKQPQTSEADGLYQDVLVIGAEAENNESKQLVAPPPSPPLPPLPDVPDKGGDKPSASPTNISVSDRGPPPRSSSSPTPAVLFSSPRPALLEHSPTPRSTPALLADANVISPQPPFEAILLSPILEGAVNPSKFIVTLETCTTTYRTTLRSLMSRSSHLSRYISSLLSPVSETASVYSNSSDTSSGQNSSGFSAFFRDHLASSGCLPQSSGIHVFLDRPSAPYTHVLAYLRSPLGTPEHPEVLPRAVQLCASPSESDSRLEALLEVRDEAHYLGLVQLEKLCIDEINRFQCTPPLPTASGPAGGNPRGQTGSVHSFRTVVERCLNHARQESLPSEPLVPKSSSTPSIGRRSAKSVTHVSTPCSSLENKNMSVRERGRQTRGIRYEVGSPPPGWI